MRILVPYNEILPKKKAHDLFLFQECSALAAAGCDVKLLIGKGSLDDEALFAHYAVTTRFTIKRLPLLRKNNPLNISWNLPFFHFVQKEIEKERPDIVLLSVLKQGIYHLKYRLPSVRYIYEAHELSTYDSTTYKEPADRYLLSQADAIAVTTSAMRTILTQKPYALHTPIATIPLAVHATPLPPPTGPRTLYYVGQLYEGQGLPLLLHALTHVPTLPLTIIGGTPAQIASLQILAASLHLTSRITWKGFLPPSTLPHHLQGAHGFVAPFLPTGRMPYVAHTKLHEYANWGRPVIAPLLPPVLDIFPPSPLLFHPGDPHSLATSLHHFLNGTTSSPLAPPFTWPNRIHSLLSLFS